ncbi:MAG: TetR/AcrR family transcriptional regulator, partial [Burkholderiales bacterium]|nr:TetR/AcrR family transcriptional regulator [Burkholderiales bacterium]
MAEKKKSKAAQPGARKAVQRIRRDPERTRSRILDAARVEFARRG